VKIFWRLVLHDPNGSFDGTPAESWLDSLRPGQPRPPWKGTMRGPVRKLFAAWCSNAFEYGPETPAGPAIARGLDCHADRGRWARIIHNEDARRLALYFEPAQDSPESGQACSIAAPLTPRRWRSQSRARAFPGHCDARREPCARGRPQNRGATRGNVWRLLNTPRRPRANPRRV